MKSPPAPPSPPEYTDDQDGALLRWEEEYKQVGQALIATRAELIERVQALSEDLAHEARLMLANARETPEIDHLADIAHIRRLRREIIDMGGTLTILKRVGEALKQRAMPPPRDPPASTPVVH